MRKVMMVVAVLMTSCQVSEKPKSGPLKSQIRMVASASRKASEVPVQQETVLASRSGKFPVRFAGGVMLEVRGKPRAQPLWSLQFEEFVAPSLQRGSVGCPEGGASCFQ